MSRGTQLLGGVFICWSDQFVHKIDHLVLTLKDGGSKVGREDLPRGEQDHAEGETNIHEGV